MNLSDLRKRLEPLLRRIFHLYWRLVRGMTLGVRAVVLTKVDIVVITMSSRSRLRAIFLSNVSSTMNFCELSSQGPAAMKPVAAPRSRSCGVVGRSR